MRLQIRQKVLFFELLHGLLEPLRACLWQAVNYSELMAKQQTKTKRKYPNWKWSYDSVRREVTEREISAIQALYKLRSTVLKSGSFEKRFVKSVYGLAVHHEKPGISDRQATVLWQIYDKYRAQVEANLSDADKLDNQNQSFLRELGKEIDDDGT